MSQCNVLDVRVDQHSRDVQDSWIQRGKAFVRQHCEQAQLQVPKQPNPLTAFLFALTWAGVGRPRYLNESLHIGLRLQTNVVAVVRGATYL